MEKNKNTILESELKLRLLWFIKLRWIAIIGVFIVISGTKFILSIELPFSRLYLGNIILLVYNIFCFIIYKKSNSKGSKNNWYIGDNAFANLQISLDLILLTYFLYFSGGIENPFLFFYFFHMVIASILLTNKAAYIQATIAIILVGTLLLSNYLHFIPHHHLSGIIPKEYCIIIQDNYIKGVYGIFSITLYIIVFISTTIVNKLRQRETELEILNEKLAEQDRLKSEYVLTVSHDLKSSLASIQSCLKVVLDNYAGNISDKAREMVGRAEVKSKSLIQFVKDLLNLSRIRATKNLKRSKISLLDCLKKIIEQLNSKVEEKNLKLTIKGFTSKQCVYMNNDELEEVFMNLISNAIKYTPENGKVKIHCASTHKKGYYTISITDTGIGIPEGELSDIFNDFFRASNASDYEKDGSGLGLSIVKHIIESSGGNIWAKSEINKGTIINFNIPAKN